MRYKSIATKTNFLTGETVEMEKLKELILPARGIATIELFDSKSGKKVEEIKSENFITLNMKDYLLAGMTETFSTLALSQNTFSPYPINEPIDYNNSILLTTDDREEAPNVERYPYGKVVGFSTRSTYSGSNIYRGTLNTSESFTQRGLCHMVFDFPTHAANGVFSSIYLIAFDYPSMDDSSQNSYLFGTPVIFCPYKDWLTFQTNKPSSAAGIESFCFDGDNKLYYSYNKTVYVADVTWGTGFDEGRIDTMEAVSTLSSSNTILDITVTPTHIYCTDGTANIYKIDKMAKTYQTINISSILDEVYGICWTGDKFIVVGEKQDVSRIASFNGNFEVIQAKDLRLRDTISYVPNLPQLAYDNLNREVVYLYNEYIDSDYCSFLGRIDTESLTVKSDLVAKDKNSSSQMELEGLDVRNGLIYARRQGYYTIAAIKGCMVWARNLLPSPVEKTSTNTMKVTYDIAII